MLSIQDIFMNYKPAKENKIHDTKIAFIVVEKTKILYMYYFLSETKKLFKKKGQCGIIK